MKRLLMLVMICAVLTPLRAGSTELYETRLNSGLRNFDTYSYLLIKQSRDDRTDAIKKLKQAVMISPDLPEAYFALAKASFSFSGQGVLDSVDYLVEGINAYSRNFWWSFTLAGSLYLCLLISFLITIAVIVVIRLFSDIPLVSHDLRESKSAILLLLALAGISVFSPLLFLAGALVITGLYFRNIDKTVVYIYLVFLLLSPAILKTVSILANSASSGNLQAIEKVNESRDNKYAMSALQNSGDFPSLFSYALALKRTGHYEKAIDVYKKLLAIKADPRVYVNLGNCYLGLYNFEEQKKFHLEEAIKSYSAALNIRPMASAYYNLSQVSREMLDFAKGVEYFNSALKLDRVAVTSYRNISARTPNRLVADETLSFSELWECALQKSHPVSSFGLVSAPALVLSAVALFLLAAFYLLSSYFRQRAYRCRKCHAILCPKCEKRLVWGQMCAQCYGSLIKLDELDVKERVARILSIYNRQRTRRNIMKVLSFILPGSPQVFAGKILSGFSIMWTFLFFLLIPAVMKVFMPNNYLVSHSIFKWAAVFFSTAQYCIINIITRQRISKGWL